MSALPVAALRATEHMTILVVEDDPGIARLERRRLERAGYATTLATSAAEALRRVAEGGIDLIVLDHSLPGGITGLELYAQLKDAGHDLPVIIVTGNSSEATVIRALRLGVRDFVTKSLEYLDYLPEAVGRVLAQVHTERRLDASERRFRALVQNSSDGIVAIDAAGKVQYASPAVERILGYSPEELALTWDLDMIHPDEQGQARRMFATTLAEPGTAVAEVRVRHQNGDWRDIEMIGTNLLDQPSIGALVVNFRDITERKELERQLVHQAFHDNLTGLPNRALFMDRLNHALLWSGRHDRLLAILFLDLDRFKVVNDSLGHVAGDQLLRVIAGRIRECVRPEDTVARLGGDEFVILMEDIDGIDTAVRTADQIAGVLDAPVRLDGQEVFVTASIGIAANTPEHASGTALLRDADVALYRAKDGGRARCEIFDPSMNSAARARLALETDLRHAIGPGACSEFRVHYQPLVDLATSRIVGLEALVRWQHPRRGLLAPGTFIALAEETGLIVPLGRWVLHEACRQVCAWQELTDASGLLLNVNLSARQLQDPEICGDIARILAETGLNPASLELEITESVLMGEAEFGDRALPQISALGVRLAIDDFGTGYSSLAYLKRLPVDTLKIDRAFVSGLAHDPADAAIIGAVVTLARALGLAVTAEGVETIVELTRLQELGCNQGQGYYFSRPLSPEATTALLMDRGTVR